MEGQANETFTEFCTQIGHTLHTTRTPSAACTCEFLNNCIALYDAAKVLETDYRQIISQRIVFSIDLRDGEGYIIYTKFGRRSYLDHDFARLVEA